MMESPRVDMTPRGKALGKVMSRQLADDQWQIFTELDLQGESEQIQLAGFLDCLIRSFQDPLGGPSLSLQALEGEVEEEEPELGGRGAAEAAPTAAGAGVLGSRSLQLSGTRASVSGLDQSQLAEFGPLPKGPLTPETATTIIEVYRRGGVLSLKSVKKILRDIYKALKALPNIIPVKTPPAPGRLHVIGDLHGQLPDLLHIIDDAGLPAADNVFVFNGDFVDRGPCSVEIVMVLFASMLAWPDAVFLNRGNHEDHVICCQPPPPYGCGGFQRECKEKYDDLTFSMIVEVFRYLPIVHTIDGKVIVVHGGLFGRPGVTLADLAAIDRLDYCPAPPPEPEPTTPEEDRAQDLRQLMRDCLWSDPKDSPGCELNATRRQGQLFGPDVTEEFLATNGLLMVVRSHECVKLGFDQPYERQPHLLATIFSASGYSGSSNLGAYMSFCRAKSPDEKTFTVGPPSQAGIAEPLYYTIHDYSVSEATSSLENRNRTSLRALILRKRQALLDEFTALDPESTGKVSTAQWASAMGKATGLVIAWATLLPLVGIEASSDETINYLTFLGDLRVNSTMLSQTKDSEALFNAMYANRATLEVIFNFFDTNGDGTISKEEFRKGCEVINARLPPSQTITDPDAVLGLMDIDHNDGIDINEFFEVFRLVDAMDGKMDGQFGILKTATPRK